MKAPSPPKDRVAELMAQGLDGPTIRQRMGISKGALCFHVASIRRDLGWQAQ